MKNRIIELDILRGIALFGILIVNIFVFNAPYIHYFEHYGTFSGLNGSAVETVLLMFGDKFMPIYAFLFGYGTYLIQRKFKTSGDFRKYYSKRLSVLFIFGVIHVVFFWFGDILISYALLGFVLLLLTGLKNKTLLFISVLTLLFIPIYFIGTKYWGLVSYRPDEIIPYQDFKNINTSSNYFSILKLRLSEYYFVRFEQLLYYYPKALTLFIIGYVAARKEIVAVIKNQIKKSFAVLFSVAVFPILWYVFKDQLHPYIIKNAVLETIGTVIYFVIPVFHAVAYILLIILICQSRSVSMFLRVFSYSGRMSLTNYLLQTIICVFVFYGYGLGLYGSVEPISLILLATGIYISQSIFSYFWIRKYGIGPFEKLWAVMTSRMTLARSRPQPVK